jgi:hypothetical protein
MSTPDWNVSFEFRGDIITGSDENTGCERFVSDRAGLIPTRIWTELIRARGDLLAVPACVFDLILGH